MTIGTMEENDKARILKNDNLILMGKLKKVIKRTGEQVDFDSNKIENAISRASLATDEMDYMEIINLTKLVCGKFSKSIMSIEEIQDIVEKTLMEQGYYKTAKAYIIYRNKRTNVRETGKVVIQVEDTIKEYLDKLDWRVNANANQGYSLGGLILNTSGKITANYWLNYVYPTEVKEAHINGDLHIHDLDMLAPYCAGWSLKSLLLEGFNGVPGKVESNPPKYLKSAVGQCINFLGTLQNEWAGAQAFSSFDTYLAPYVKNENLSYREVKQEIQSFVYNSNVSSRWGNQSPFVNVTFDWVCPDDLKNKKPIINNKIMPFTYNDCQKEMDVINKAFLEVMLEGDAKGRCFTFPIPTYNLTKDFNWDSENAPLLFELTAKYGTPNFSNFINSSLDPQDVRSMCCRLRLDLKELRVRGGSLFGSNEMTGSVGVITINLPRLGYLSESKEEFLERLGRLCDIAKTSLEIKRKVIQKNIDQGLYPYTKRYLPSLRNHFSTIGINGCHEAFLNLFNKGIETDEGKEFAIEILNYMRSKIQGYQEETGNLYNLEATPAEGTAYRFAKEDQKRFPNIIQSGTKDAPYYTNSTQLPASFTNDMIKAIRHQEDIQDLYTGGTVLHFYLGERVRDWETCRALVKKISFNSRLPYFTVVPKFSICHTHGYFSGEVRKCPECGKECEIWSRVMGYYRPESQCNKGKQSEWKERVNFKV